MMIILLYFAAILIETILLVKYLRLRLVEVRLPEPCSSLVKHLNISQGAQWLSGRVLDSRPKGSGFEPHRRHCVVVLEQDTFILA